VLSKCFSRCVRFGRFPLSLPWALSCSSSESLFVRSQVPPHRTHIFSLHSVSFRSISLFILRFLCFSDHPRLSSRSRYRSRSRSRSCCGLECHNHNTTRRPRHTNSFPLVCRTVEISSFDRYLNSSPSSSSQVSSKNNPLTILYPSPHSHRSPPTSPTSPPRLKSPVTYPTPDPKVPRVLKRRNEVPSTR